MTTETAPETFGEAIRSARLHLGITQQHLSDQLDVDQSVVSDWETGQSLPRYGRLVPLCDALGLNRVEMLELLAQQQTPEVA